MVFAMFAPSMRKRLIIDVCAKMVTRELITSVSLNVLRIPFKLMEYVRNVQGIHNIAQLERYVCVLKITI